MKIINSLTPRCNGSEDLECICYVTPIAERPTTKTSDVLPTSVRVGRHKGFKAWSLFGYSCLESGCYSASSSTGLWLDRFFDSFILDAIQNAIDEASRILRPESFSEVDCFVHGHLGRISSQ